MMVDAEFGDWDNRMRGEEGWKISVLSLEDGGSAGDLLQGETLGLNFEERLRQMKTTTCLLGSLAGMQSWWDLHQKRKNFMQNVNVVY